MAFSLRKHGSIFIGKDSLKKLSDILSNYNSPLLLLSNSSDNNPALDNVKKQFDRIMIKNSGEPTNQVIDNFVSKISESIDLVVAIGGGSLIDFAKVVAILLNNKNKSTKDFYGISNRNDAVDLVAIPTTAGTGSEVTGVSVVIDSESKMKFGILGDDIIPRYAILDPILSVTLNKRFTVSTGVDALTHALEAFCSKNASIATDMYAEEAVEIIWKTLPILIEDLENVILRERILYASMLAGLAFGNAGTGAVHGFAHIVGGKYNISHGEANSIFLSPVMWYNFNYNKDKIIRLFKKFDINLRDAGYFSNTIKNFLFKVKAPVSFEDVGVEKIEANVLYDLMPKQKRLFDKTKHSFSFDDVNNIINSL